MAQIESMLLQGSETEESIDILLKLARLESNSMRSALMYHLVSGAADAYACMAHGVSKGNFSRDLKKINNVARDIDRYFEINYKKSAS